MDRAGAQQDLAAGAYRALLAADRDLHAVGMGAVALELQGVDDRIADDGEVGPAARGLEIAVVGRDAQAIAAVDRVGRGAGAFGRVVVLAPAVAQADRGLHHRAVGRTPRLDGRAIDGDRAAVAVIGPVTEIDVGLELAKVRQHVCPAPAARAQGRPVLVIVGNAADRDLAVDGRAAADRAAAPQQFRLLAFGAPR